MITIQAAIDMATEEGFTITTDRKIRGLSRPPKSLFYVKHKKSGFIRPVKQAYYGSKTWEVDGERGTRAQMIVEAMRQIKRELNEAWGA